MGEALVRDCDAMCGALDVGGVPSCRVCCSDRVAHCINVLVTSHAAQPAQAVTAHLLSSLVAPLDPAAALGLCPQQQVVRLIGSSTGSSGGSNVADGWCGTSRTLRLRMHASLFQVLPSNPQQQSLPEAQDDRSVCSGSTGAGPPSELK